MIELLTNALGAPKGPRSADADHAGGGAGGGKCSTIRPSRRNGKTKSEEKWDGMGTRFGWKGSYFSRGRGVCNGGEGWIAEMALQDIDLFVADPRTRESVLCSVNFVDHLVFEWAFGDCSTSYGVPDCWVHDLNLCFWRVGLLPPFLFLDRGSLPASDRMGG